MLRATNIYNRDVSDIKYTNSQQDEITLLALVKVEASLGHSYRGRSERNLQLAYESIVFAIEKYLESYSAPFSFKQCTKAKFAKWMDKICDAYDISDPTCHNKLRVSNNEIDTGIVMLKALHPRKGVSIEELHDQLHRSKRAIQKDLVKLDSSLYKRGMSNQEKKRHHMHSFCWVVNLFILTFLTMIKTHIGVFTPVIRYTQSSFKKTLPSWLHY